MGTYEKLRYLVDVRKGRLNRVNLKIKRSKYALAVSVLFLLTTGLWLLVSPTKIIALLLLTSIITFRASAHTYLNLLKYADREHEVLSMAKEKEEHYSKTCYLESPEEEPLI